MQMLQPTAKLTLPIKIGKKYVRRDGKVVTVLEPHKAYRTDPQIAYVGDDHIAGVNGYHHCWLKNGRIHGENATDHSFDLVSDWEEGQGHKHADLMLQYAQDSVTDPYAYRNWQYRRIGDKNWVDCRAIPNWSKDTDYRKVPDTVVINAVRVPKGLTVEPAYDTKIYVVDFYNKIPVQIKRWEGDWTMKLLLERGLVFSNESDAEATANAMLKFQNH